MKGYITVEETGYVVQHRNEEEKERNKKKYKTYTIKEHETKELAGQYLSRGKEYTHMLQINHIIYYHEGLESAEQMYKRMKNKGTRGLKKIRTVKTNKKEKQKEKKAVKDTRKSDVFSNGIIERVAELSKIIKEIEGQYKKLRVELIEVNKERTDIYHKIEDDIGCASTENKLRNYAVLEEILERRRTIKNDIDLIKCIKEKDIASIDDKRVQSIEDMMKKRVYHPRKRNDIFE